MLIVFAIILAVASGLTMLAMIAYERRLFSVSNFDFTEKGSIQDSMSITFQTAISDLAFGLLSFVRRLIKHLSIRFLVILHGFISLSRALLTRIEHRFSVLIDAVRGRGHSHEDHHRGSVSFFLEQLKDYKEEMTRRTGIR